MSLYFGIAANALIKTESIINAKYFSETSINLDSTIVETSDKLNIPPHYLNISL